MPKAYLLYSSSLIGTARNVFHFRHLHAWLVSHCYEKKNLFTYIQAKCLYIAELNGYKAQQNCLFLLLIDFCIIDRTQKKIVCLPLTEKLTNGNVWITQFVHSL